MAKKEEHRKGAGQPGKKPEHERATPGQEGWPERENTGKPSTGNRPGTGNRDDTQPRLPTLDPEPAKKLPVFTDVPPPEMHDSAE